MGLGGFWTSAALALAVAGQALAQQPAPPPASSPAPPKEYTQQFLVPGSSFHGVHGIAFAPHLGRGFISDGDDSSVTIFDLGTRRIVGHVRTGGDPDAIVFDSATGRIFTMNAKGENSTAIEAATERNAFSPARP